jgi:hypothetical protein
VRSLRPVLPPPARLPIASLLRGAPPPAPPPGAPSPRSAALRRELLQSRCFAKLRYNGFFAGSSLRPRCFVARAQAPFPADSILVSSSRVAARPAPPAYGAPRGAPSHANGRPRACSGQFLSKARSRLLRARSVRARRRRLCVRHRATASSRAAPPRRGLATSPEARRLFAMRSVGPIREHSPAHARLLRAAAAVAPLPPTRALRLVSAALARVLQIRQTPVRSPVRRTPGVPQRHPHRAVLLNLGHHR